MTWPTEPIDKYLLHDGDQNAKVYIVLGGHRQGTSFLSRALRQAGVKMKGGPQHFEDGDFVGMNLKIIQAAGGIWREPPGSDELLEAGELHWMEIANLLSEKRDRGGRFWGWKDPRQPLTIRSYIPLLQEMDDDVYLICIFRKPERAIASLRRLGQASPKQAETMVRRYAEEIIAAIKAWVGLED
jgi:hypothetical protein